MSDEWGQSPGFVGGLLVGAAWALREIVGFTRSRDGEDTPVGKTTPADVLATVNQLRLEVQQLGTSAENRFRDYVEADRQLHSSLDGRVADIERDVQILLRSSRES